MQKCTVEDGPNTDLLSCWIRRFLLEHLVAERNLAHNTQMSYRDVLQQFLPFIARAAHRRIDGLRVDDISPARTRAFLLDVENTRECGIANRNQRLAAIRSLAKFIGKHNPEYLEWSGQIRTIMSKKKTRPHIDHRDSSQHAFLNRRGHPHVAEITQTFQTNSTQID